MRQRALWMAIAPVLFVTSALAFGPAASPGVIFDLELKNLTSATPTVSTIHYAIEGQDVKATVATATGTTTDMIFHGAKQEMIIINNEAKTYMVMDKAAIDQLMSQLGGVMAQMQEAMKNMPPEQRAAMEKMMAGRMGGAATPAAEPLVMHNTGERGTQAGYAAVRWEARRGDKKVRDMWVTPWANIHGATEAQDAMKAMAEFGKSMMDSLSKSGLPIGRQMDDSLFQFEALGGFPVVTREFGDNGQATSETTLKGAREETIPASEFQPPAGYRQQQMGGRGR